MYFIIENYSVSISPCAAKQFWDFSFLAQSQFWDFNYSVYSLFLALADESHRK